MFLNVGIVKNAHRIHDCNLLGKFKNMCLCAHWRTTVVCPGIIKISIFIGITLHASLDNVMQEWVLHQVAHHLLQECYTPKRERFCRYTTERVSRYLMFKLNHVSMILFPAIRCFPNACFDVLYTYPSADRFCSHGQYHIHMMLIRLTLLMNIRMAMVMMITWLDWSFMISAWISRSLDIVIFSQSFCGAGVVWRVKACWTSWTCWKGARTGAGTWAQNWTPAWCLLRRPACWWDAWKGLINWLKLRSMGLST